MADSQWDDRLKSFLKKTGEDLKRLSVEVKDEAQKLMVEVQDPERQRQLKEGLKEVSTWARRAAEDVATVVEDGVKKAEVVLGKASERVGDLMARPAAPPPPDPTPRSPPPPPAAKAPEAPAPAARPRKTIGGAKKASPPARPRPAKTIGRVKDDGEE